MAHIRVFNHYVQSPFVLLAALEFFLLAACCYVSIVLWGWGNRPSFLPIDYIILRYSLVYALIMLLSTLSLGVYGAAVVERFAGMAVRSVVSYCLLGCTSMVVLFYLVPEFDVGRRPLFASVILSLAVILPFRKLFYAAVGADNLKRRVMVLGAGAKALAVKEAASTPGLGFDVIGFIPSDHKPPEIEQDLLLDAMGGVQRLVNKHKVDEIVIAVDERRRDAGGYFPIEELLECKMKGVKITEAVKFYERELGRIELEEIHPGWMVFGDGFQYSQLRDVVKRGFDIAVCLVLLLLAWPLMLFAVVAILLETGRPVIYKQVRVGLNGKPFNIYKFRSMSQDAEKDGKAQWAKANDSRVTRVGAFIRNTRIDELPQILNVLKGDMSFVGPRPERPEFVKDLNQQLPYYESRHRVKPGLMGWAQLKFSYGASVEDAGNKLVYDLYYVKNYSLLLDILIVVQSVEIILLGKGVR